MTDYDYWVKLAFFTQDEDEKISQCSICGCDIVSKHKNAPKKYCDSCVVDLRRQRQYRFNRTSGNVKFNFDDDPVVSLVYAVISHALDDRDWQRKFKPDGHELSLVDCGAREFIEDGGVELWLSALGIGVQPSLTRQMLEEMFEDGK